MTVKQLADRVRVAPHVVRYYTQRGLLRPQRNSANGYRQYAESELHRLRFICRAKTVGFTLGEIAQILRDVDGGAPPSDSVRRLIRDRLNRNEKRLEDAQRLQQRVREAVEAWESDAGQQPREGGPRPLIDALALDEE
jgi:DNA-binding transcriptional MerR regulator